MSLVQKFQQVSGKVNAGGLENSIENGRLDGTQLSFTVNEHMGGEKIITSTGEASRVIRLQEVLRFKGDPLLEYIRGWRGHRINVSLVKEAMMVTDMLKEISEEVRMEVGRTPRVRNILKQWSRRATLNCFNRSS